MIVQVLQQIIRNFASRNRKRKPPVVSQIDHVAARSEQQQRIRLSLRARGDMIDAVSPRHIPVLIRNRRDRHRRRRIALRLRVHENLTPPARIALCRPRDSLLRHCYDLSLKLISLGVKLLIAPRARIRICALLRFCNANVRGSLVFN